MKDPQAWDGIAEDFWQCIDRVRRGEDTEADAATFVEVLELARDRVRTGKWSYLGFSRW